MRILVAGSSGFLGTALVGALRADGHQVVRLVRRPTDRPDELTWQPGGELDPATLAGAGAVVNLAGSPLSSRVGPVQLPVRPWTRSYRREFFGSRVASTTTLARAVAAADPRPPVFLVGSGVGYYGDTGDQVTDETGPPGRGYFAATAQATEEAAGAAAAAGVRVVRLRTGLPLDRGGGVLGPLLLPFRLGLGGRVGSGSQWQPWISMADWLAAVRFLLAREDVDGPVNLVGPAPVTNAELTQALAHLLRRPAVLPVPRVTLRVLLGEFGKEAVSSKRVVPRVLTRAGFQFTHPDLDSALGAALAPPSEAAPGTTPD